MKMRKYLLLLLLPLLVSFSWNGATISTWNGKTLATWNGVGAIPCTAQTIHAITYPSSMIVGDTDQTLNYSASSGLTISYGTSTPSYCTIVDGNKLHAVARSGANGCIVQVTQSGNGTYCAAEVDRSVTIAATSSWTDWKYPGTVTGNTNAGQSGSVEWGNPTFIQGTDTQYATAYIGPGTTSKDLLATNFAFTTSDVPLGSAILGIEIETRSSQSSSHSALHNFWNRLTLSGGYIGISQSNSLGLTQSFINDGIGSSGKNVWGTNLITSQIIDSTFGVGYVITNIGTGGAGATAYVDHIKMRISYEAP